jgi:hypothetical protein
LPARRLGDLARRRLLGNERLDLAGHLGQELFTFLVRRVERRLLLIEGGLVGLGLPPDPLRVGAPSGELVASIREVIEHLVVARARRGGVLVARREHAEVDLEQRAGRPARARRAIHRSGSRAHDRLEPLGFRPCGVDPRGRVRDRLRGLLQLQLDTLDLFVEHRELLGVRSDLDLELVCLLALVVDRRGSRCTGERDRRRARNDDGEQQEGDSATMHEYDVT